MARRNTWKRVCFGAASALAVGVAATLTIDDAWAAEGAASLYLPGSAGDLLIAVSPQPGLTASGGLFIQSGNVGTAVLQGAVNVGIDVDLVLKIAGLSYTFETPIEDLTYTIGALVPFGQVDLAATIIGPMGNAFSASQDAYNIADSAITPLALNWKSGDFHVRFAQTIYAPTGAYDPDKVVNIGRNYWGFDTSAALTYFNQNTGTEISFAPGILINRRNPDTDYRTGPEFHLDVTASQFLSETFAVGARAYYYRQVGGDSGSGARLGDFKGEAFGIGPGFFWTPKFAGGKLVVVGKYLRDVTTTNRFKSDYGTIGAAWKF